MRTFFKRCADKAKLTLVIFSLSAFSVMGQTYHSGARFSSMSDAAVAMQDVWSVQQNQAGLCELKQAHIAFGSAPSVFGNDVKRQALVMALPYRSSIFGLGFQRYGISEYNEQKVGLSYARSFNNLYVALHGNFHQLFIQNYGSASALSLEVGMQYWVNDNWCLGLHVTNPSNSRYGNIEAPIAKRFQIGTSYRFSEELLLASSINMITSQPTDLGFGLEYNLLNVLLLRGGISLEPVKHYVGLGIHSGSWKLDIATPWHAVLGYAPQIGLSYAL